MRIFEQIFFADKAKNLQAYFRMARIFNAVCNKICRKDVGQHRTKIVRQMQSSNFSSDETKSGVNTCCIHEHFCEI